MSDVKGAVLLPHLPMSFGLFLHDLGHEQVSYFPTRQRPEGEHQLVYLLARPAEADRDLIHQAAALELPCQGLLEHALKVVLIG